jgi:hypothetical protein
VAGNAAVAGAVAAGSLPGALPGPAPPLELQIRPSPLDI